jgi:hypothetical protein
MNRTCADLLHWLPIDSTAQTSPPLPALGLADRHHDDDDQATSDALLAELQSDEQKPVVMRPIMNDS